MLTEKRTAVGIDLGASSIKSVAVQEDRLAAKARVELADPAPEAVADQIAAAVAALPGPGHGPVGVAVPGVLDAERRVLVQSANLDWEDVPFAELLESRIDREVILEKDGAAAALGESWLGAGRGAASMLMVALGTGIGGGVVLGGRLWRGRSGYAGGIGHVVVAPDGPQCRCGAKGCLEAVIAVREPAAEAPGPALRMLAAAEGTDPTAGARLQMALMDLAGVLAAAVSTLNPERLVVGGGVLHDVPRLVDRLAELVMQRVYGQAAAGLGIVPARLGIYSGAAGAARIALDAQGR